MAHQGVPVSTAAASLGHDPAIYLRTYAHLYPGDLRSAGDAMDSARLSAARPRRVGRSEDPSATGNGVGLSQECQVHVARGWVNPPSQLPGQKVTLNCDFE